MRRARVMEAAEAAAIVEEGQTLATSGYVGAGYPEALVRALRERFDESGGPGDLTLVHAAGQGDWRERGLAELAVPGLLRRVVGGYFATAPALCDLIAEDLVEAYTFPQGVIAHLFRNTAAGRPGVFSHVGLGTFVDPRVEGGRANAVTTEQIVRVVQVGGEELLFYPSFHLDVAFVRATTADTEGNLSMEREAATLEHLAIAQATRRCGGTVVAQVERLAEAGSLDPRRVRVPGNLVDAVVVAPPELHWQTFGTPFEPGFTGDVRVPVDRGSPFPLRAEKVMARRAVLELGEGDVVNMYHGPSEALARVAREEGLLDLLHLTVASGAVGGQPAGGLSYGLAWNPDAILDQPAMFDLYHGGGLDAAVLPMVQVDGEGNVNSTRYGRTIKGCGSFVDVSQTARTVIFVGTMTVGCHVRADEGALTVLREGRPRRFVPRVDQLSFSAAEARRRGQRVLYVTERALFRLGDEGLELVEVAPGVDVGLHVTGVAGCSIRAGAPPRTMDARIFREAPMGFWREEASHG